MRTTSRTISTCAVLLGMLFSMPALSDSPSIEKTLLFIEKVQMENMTEPEHTPGWKWEYQGEGAFKHYMKTQSPGSADYSELVSTFDIRDFDRISILSRNSCGADIPKCKKKVPSLRLLCRDGKECAKTHSSSTYDWATDQDHTYEYFGVSQGVGNLEKEALYKLKNAFLHLASLHDVTLKFDDEHFIDDMFSGSQ